MEPAVYDLTIEQGSSWSRRFQFQSGDPLEVLDLSGSIVRADIRTTAQGRLLQSFKVEDPDLEEGTFTLSLSPSQTQALPAGDLEWDLVIKHSDDSVGKYLKGDLTVNPTITRHA